MNEKQERALALLRGTPALQLFALFDLMAPMIGVEPDDMYSAALQIGQAEADKERSREKIAKDHHNCPSPI